MKERAAEAGGILKIITSPEKGTTIRVEFGE
jgi:signal transduction histidine kinase